MNCAECKDFCLYHDCDDPEILPAERLVRKPENCTTWLTSGYCVHIADGVIYESTGI